MVCFQTKNPNLGKFRRLLHWKMLVFLNGHFVHFTVLCYILWTFGIVCGNLVYFSRFGILCEEKSGNPGLDNTTQPRRQGIFKNAFISNHKSHKRCILSQFTEQHC
jgi:hypothetical protein